MEEGEISNDDIFPGEKKKSAHSSRSSSEKRAPTPPQKLSPKHKPIRKFSSNNENNN